MKARYDAAAPTGDCGAAGFFEVDAERLSEAQDGPHLAARAKSWYAEKFRLVMETPVTPDQALADAEAELKKTRAEMLAIALPLHKQYFPDHDEHTEPAPRERENKIIGEVLHKICGRSSAARRLDADGEGRSCRASGSSSSTRRSCR